MDLYCPTCSEPIDNDEFHDEAEYRKANAPRPNTAGALFALGTTYSDVAADFRQRGCKALTSFGPATHCVPAENDRTAAAKAMYELLGDDMDGAAAMFEDLGL